MKNLVILNNESLKWGLWMRHTIEAAIIKTIIFLILDDKDWYIVLIFLISEMKKHIGVMYSPFPKGTPGKVTAVKQM